MTLAAPMAMTQPAQTLAQKLIARAAGRPNVRVGEIVNCQIDLAMFHDSSGPRRLAPMLQRLGVGLWDKSKVVLVTDHYVPEQDEDSRQILRFTREWARREAIPHFHDAVGICHVVLPQQGHLHPGMFVVGGDSHSTTGGAFGVYMFGVGATDMLGAVATGETWVQVPATQRMHWRGRLGAGVTAKDMALHMAGRFGMNGGAYGALEFCGDAIRALDMEERMTLSNMAAEMGAQVGLIAPDDTTRQWLATTGAPAAEAGDWSSDSEAVYEQHDFDATALEPQVAAPHSPANTTPVSGVAGTAIDLAYIGSCTGAKLTDMHAAAQILRGNHVASGVTLRLAPASLQDQEAARVDGSLQVLLDAGADLQPTSCGACAGYGAVVPAGSTVISSTARNFRGRMGPASARIYLGSPYTVAASALRGRISDPREFLT